jgi:hypothetical protein
MLPSASPEQASELDSAKGSAARMGVCAGWAFSVELRTWVRGADGRPADSGGAEPEGVEAELVRLRAETARLLKAEKEWQLEREILRRAAQYFAKEMK